MTGVAYKQQSRAGLIASTAIASSGQPRSELSYVQSGLSVAAAIVGLHRDLYLEEPPYGRSPPPVEVIV
jgi:hypothetical protein